jgi:hypothetical protein
MKAVQYAHSVAKRYERPPQHLADRVTLASSEVIETT